MAKTFYCRRTPEATEVASKTLARVRNHLNKIEKRSDRKGQKTLEVTLLLATMYYIVADYCNAEPLLKKYLMDAKKVSAQNPTAFLWASSMLAMAYSAMNRIPEAVLVMSEAKALTRTIDISVPDPVFQALELQALSFDAEDNLESRQQGLAVAFMALCFSISHGLYRAQWGAQALDHLRLHFSSYGIVLDRWNWLVKHAHLTKYDFIGLLSIVLHNADLTPVSVKSWMKREPRVIEVR